MSEKNTKLYFNKVGMHLLKDTEMGRTTDINQSFNQYCFIVRPKFVEIAGQFGLSHVAITKTERNTTKT